MNNSPHTTSKLIIRNSILNVITNIIYVVIGFFIIPFFISHLGQETFGVWVLIGSIFRYRNILSLGLNSAINRYIPVALAKKDDTSIIKVVSSSTIFFLFISILLLIATFIFYYFINDWFRIPDHLQNISKTLVLIVGIGFSITIPLNQFTAVLSGYQRYDIINIGLLFQIIFRTVLLIVLITKGYSLLTMGVIFAVAELSLRIFHLLYAKRLMQNRINISFKGYDYNLLREMISYGFNTFLFTISAVIIYRFSDLIIGIYLTTADITRYSVLTITILVLSQLLQTFLSAIKPAVSDLDARNDEIRIKEIAILSQKYSLIFLIPSSLFLILMGKEFLFVWLGADFSHLSNILTILTIGNFFYLAQYSNFLVLVGKGKHRIFGLLSITMAFFTIVLAIVSFSIFKMGLLGMALSTAIPMMLIAGLALQLYFNNNMKISLLENFRSIWYPAFLGCVPGIAILGIWKYSFPPNSWFQISLVIISTIIITFLGTWFFSLSEQERKRFLGFLKFNS